MTAYVQSLPNSPIPPQHHQHHMPVAAVSQLHNARRNIHKFRFYAEFSQCLFDFVIQLLPTNEELAVKEDVRKLLERLIRTIEPDSRLLSFGSTANGFALKNSDMDLCCLIDSEERLAASDLVNMLGDLLERETKFRVKPLPLARIPIVKLSLDPSPGLPLGIACDIGFENRLALENTRLLMCYAMIDPARVRTMVLFLKVWSKRRKINSPYKGTLSSYGYVLLVLYFLIHVKNPPVLPNLQQLPPLRPINPEDTMLGSHDIWFFDDIELLRQQWQSANTESVAELLADFFRYYSKDFPYNHGVVSIRAGLLKKDAKGWQSEADRGRYGGDPRERNRLCIEDPFETEYNVARCVSKDGLYTIRGEFMRACKIIQSRPERAVVALAQLCEERADEELVRASPPPRAPFVPPRLTPLPPQTPYTVGSSSLRPPAIPPPAAAEKVAPPSPPKSEPDAKPAVKSAPEPPKSPPLLEHMVPTRGKWTSPPPPEAPAADHATFADRLGHGLVLATAPTEARELERNTTSSASNSEVFTDDGRVSDVADLDDVRSVRSFSEESTSQWSPHIMQVRPPSASFSQSHDLDARVLPLRGGGLRLKTGGNNFKPTLDGRGRRNGRPPEDYGKSNNPPISYLNHEALSGSPRRSISGPPRTLSQHRFSTSMPASPVLQSGGHFFSIPQAPQAATVFYETGTRKDHGARVSLSQHSPTIPSNTMYTIPGTYVSMVGPYQPHFQYPHHLMDPRLYSASPPASPGDLSRSPSYGAWPQMTQRALAQAEAALRHSSGGPKTPTPGNPGARRRPSHTHTQSNATIIAPVRSPATPTAQTRPRSRSRSPPPAYPGSLLAAGRGEPEAQASRRGSSNSPGSDSPTPSSSGSSNYVASPPSTSPSSPTQDRGAERCDVDAAEVTRRADEPEIGEVPLEPETPQGIVEVVGKLAMLD